MYSNGGMPVPYSEYQGFIHPNNYSPDQSNNHPIPGQPQMSNLPQGSPNQMAQAPYPGISHSMNIYNQAQPAEYSANYGWLQLPPNTYSYPSVPMTYAQWPYQNNVRPEAVMQAHQRQQSVPSTTLPTLPRNNSLQGSPTLSSPAHGHPQVQHANLKSGSLRQGGDRPAPQNAQRSQIQHRNDDHPPRPCSNSQKRSNSGAMLPPSKRPCHDNPFKSPNSAQRNVVPVSAPQLQNGGSISQAQATLHRRRSNIGSVQKRTEKVQRGHPCRNNVFQVPPMSSKVTSPKVAQSKAGAIQGHVDKFKARFPELRNQVNNASPNQTFHMPIYSKTEDYQRMMDNSDRERQAADEKAQQSNQTFHMPPWTKEQADNFERECLAAGQKGTKLWLLINLETEPKTLIQEAVEYRDLMGETNTGQSPGLPLNPYEDSIGPHVEFLPDALYPEQIPNVVNKIKLYSRYMSALESKMMQIAHAQSGEESLLDGIVTPVPKLFKHPQASSETYARCRKVIAPYLHCLRSALRRYQNRPQPPVPQTEEEKQLEEMFQVDFGTFIDQDMLVSTHQDLEAVGQV